MHVYSLSMPKMIFMLCIELYPWLNRMLLIKSKLNVRVTIALHLYRKSKTTNKIYIVLQYYIIMVQFLYSLLHSKQLFSWLALPKSNDKAYSQVNAAPKDEFSVATTRTLLAILMLSWGNLFDFLASTCDQVCSQTASGVGWAFCGWDITIVDINLKWWLWRRCVVAHHNLTNVEVVHFILPRLYEIV